MLNTGNPPPPQPPPPPPLLPSQNGILAPRDRACAACKHQRKKCADTCVFAPHFPPGCAREFDIAQKVFGVSNMVKMAAKIPRDQHGVFFDSIVYEAAKRHANPVTGCAGELERLRRQYHEQRLEIEVLRKRIKLHEDVLCNGVGNSNGNSNGYADCNSSYANLHGNVVHGVVGMAPDNGNGVGFPLNGLLYNGGLVQRDRGPALPNGERVKHSNSPFPTEEDERKRH